MDKRTIKMSSLDLPFPTSSRFSLVLQWQPKKKSTKNCCSVYWTSISFIKQHTKKAFPLIILTLVLVKWGSFSPPSSCRLRQCPDSLCVYKKGRDGTVICFFLWHFDFEPLLKGKKKKKKTRPIAHPAVPVGLNHWSKSKKNSSVKWHKPADVESLQNPVLAWWCFDSLRCFGAGCNDDTSSLWTLVV